MINTLAILIGNTLAIVIVAILRLNLPYGFSKGHVQAKVFVLLSIPVILGAVFGIGSAFFDGMPGDFSRVMVAICGSVGIIMPVIMSFNFWLYVETNAKGNLAEIRKRIFIALIPVAVIILLVIINLFTPVVFYISEDNIYHRGTLGLIAYVVGPLYLVVSLFRIAYIKAKKQGFLFVSIAGAVLPIAVVGVIQVMFYGVIQSWMGFAIGMLTFYIGLQKDQLYTDSMTKVFNRMHLDYVISDAKAKNITLGGLMLDIDHFKRINDTLGHRMGDEVIIKSANILKTAAKNNANVLRVGGDEFMVVGAINSLDDLELLKDRIIRNCEIENAKNDIPTKIEFSIGSAIYNPNEQTESEWISLMDKNMYEEKAKHRMERRGARRASD